MCENNKLSWTHSKRRLEHSHPLFEEGNILCCMLAKQLPFDLEADEEFLDEGFVFKNNDPTYLSDFLFIVMKMIIQIL